MNQKITIKKIINREGVELLAFFMHHLASHMKKGGEIKADKLLEGLALLGYKHDNISVEYPMPIDGLHEISEIFPKTSNNFHVHIGN